MKPGIGACTAASAAGIGRAAFARALAQTTTGLVPFDDGRLASYVGRVDAIDHVTLPPALAAWDCRATRLAWLGLQADGFAAQVPAGRVGVVIGTSASTIAVSEQAYRTLAADGGFPAAQRNPQLNTPHALAMFVQQALGVPGPCVTVSTACSSSAKAFAVGARWLRLGLCDAVVVGGIDALSDSLLHGFRALGLVAAEPCRPFDAARKGISLGEAAAFVLLQREGPLRLAGWGEANDAHHLSAPHPQGLGAEAALDAALARAGLGIEAIDHLNLHGTASAQNDEVEAALVARRYAPGTAAAATKGLTGHTMGAAGALEAVACLLAIEHGAVPGRFGTTTPDPAFGERFAAMLPAAPAARRVRCAASHSFGFGGSNAVLVFEAA